MAKVNPKDHGGDSQSMALTPEVVGNVDCAILTVKEYRDPVVGDRIAALLEFVEFPEYVLWLNKSGITVLVAKYGDESDEWLGKRVPVIPVRTQNPRTGDYVIKLHIAPSRMWDELFTDSDAATAKNTARKRTK